MKRGTTDQPLTKRSHNPSGVGPEGRARHGTAVSVGRAKAARAKAAAEQAGAQRPILVGGRPLIDSPVTWNEAAAKARADTLSEDVALKRIERETLERKRIPIEEVAAWCASLSDRLVKILASVGSLPSPTPAQAAWLNEWDRRVRAELAEVPR